MPIYFVTGKLGSGKTLASVGRIRDYVVQRRIVATNLDLYPEHWSNQDRKKWTVLRLPDKPTAEDMHALGKGNEGYDESRNGLVVLDECGTWFNARTWADKGRASLVDWFLHARKLGWDVIFIVQDLTVVDKQAKDCLCEHAVFCRRLDRMSIAVIGPLLRALGLEKVMPQIHYALVKYGHTRAHATVDRWWYRGKELYQLYDTKQVFRPEMREYLGGKSGGIYSLLTPWHLKGRYVVKGPTFRQRTDQLVKRVAQALTFAIVHVAAAVSGRRPDTVAGEWHLLKTPYVASTWRDGPLSGPASPSLHDLRFS